MANATIICWVEGDDSSFPIRINSNRLIADLKKAICEENPELLVANAKDFRLFEADIPDTDEARKGFDFKKAEMLSASKEISKLSLSRGCIHIAIKRPGK